MEIQILEPDVLPGGVKVVAQADVWTPGRRIHKPDREKRFGVGEQLTLSAGPGYRPVTNAAWSLAWSQGGAGGRPLVTTQGSADFTCPDTPPGRTSCTVRLSLKKPGAVRPSAIVTFDVVAPTTASQTYLGDQHWEDAASLKPAGYANWNPDPNGGYLALWWIGPGDVYFGGIQIREHGGSNVWDVKGICAADPTLFNKKHTDGGPEEWQTPGDNSLWREIGTAVSVDKVFSVLKAGNNPVGYISDRTNALFHQVAGSGELKIPVHYRVKGSADADGRKITEMVHGFKVTHGGEFTVYKHPVGKSALGPTKTYRRDHPQILSWNQAGALLVDVMAKATAYRRQAP